MVEIEGAIEPALDVIADRDDANSMPLSERRRLDPSARELAAPLVVVVQPEVVFQGIRADDVVLPGAEAKDDAAGRILSARDRLELHRHVEIRVRSRRRYDHV